MTEAKLKAIETRFDGHRFRSRAEARWAVFFKTVRLAYRYEAEGFDLAGTYYLPDFWLPELDCFFEVKGAERIEPEGVQKAKLLVEHSGKRLLIAFGTPSLRPNIWLIEPKFLDLYEAGKLPNFMLSDSYGRPISLMMLYDCNNACVLYAGAFDDDYRMSSVPLIAVNKDHKLNGNFFDAYDAAKAARFEHGECG